MNPLLVFFRKKVYTAILLLLLVLTFGIVGFKVISNYSWIDALYMTVITISTVGFGEVVPLNDPSKIFTIFLILISIVVVGYALSIITEYILSKNNIEALKQKKMQKLIDSYKNHIIICGYGRNGKQAARKLAAYKRSFVVIERDKDVLERLMFDNVPHVIGNANEDEVLLKAGVDRASCFISALPSDADNLFVVLSTRQINKNINIISRASQDSSYDKLKFAGANNVILPDKIGGDHMASLVVVPGLMEFLDNLSIVGKSDINIEEVAVEKLYNTKDIKTIKDLDLRRKTGCTVIGYKNEKGEYIVNPEADIKLVPNSKIIVLGRPEQIDVLNSQYNID
ncbi:MAG: potassium channel protein [Flavobacteriales bacterium]|nr:potassium channel protein [Flavobacteriia bacterium]NCP04796.1 potassium channel protein [Flavobacteriales bacterium]PIV92681.1 MAG: potassium channel protein [Flavobacteriaceae bacterium CG17_big_fil_post_rev_8_21_14_2_50_33_15]PIY11143.1 MAG: potassium channel protein [Flavobacteriaceae bacterium CG_4_10_14_3_um_filter_33_47]PJB17828.1 MAG: potassium channel protein [Flavobacteriaceae bacterium CG_4_9_14_3_um_filter_33_16]